MCLRTDPKGEPFAKRKPSCPIHFGFGSKHPDFDHWFCCGDFYPAVYLVLKFSIFVLKSLQGEFLMQIDNKQIEIMRLKKMGVKFFVCLWCVRVRWSGFFWEGAGDGSPTAGLGHPPIPGWDTLPDRVFSRTSWGGVLWDGLKKVLAVFFLPCLRSICFNSVHLGATLYHLVSCSLVVLEPFCTIAG